MHAVYAAIVLGFLVPAWIVAGIGDWWQHRRADIEHTAGWKESAFHLFMIFSAGSLLLAGLVFQINALFLAAALGLYVAHEIVATWDFTYASKYRVISITEQRFHDYLTAIPFALLFLTLVAYWEQSLALLGLGSAEGDFSVRFKEETLPLWYFGAFFVGSVLNVTCYLEEFARCWRLRK